MSAVPEDARGPTSRALPAPYAAGLLLVLLVSCGAAWWWCFEAWRSPGYSSGGLWFLVVALAVAGAALYRAPALRLSIGWLLTTGAILTLYGAAGAALPPQGAALLAAVGLATAWLAVSRGTTLAGRWGIAALFPLTLPMGVGVDFYVGFPLRLLVTQATAALLGPQVHATGTALSDGVNTVFVDAPCAGLRMLGTSLMLAAATGAIGRAEIGRTLLLLLFGGGIALLGNIARAATLYFVETVPALQGTSHEAVGLAIFVSCAALQIALAWKLCAPGIAVPRGTLAPVLQPQKQWLTIAAVGLCVLGVCLSGAAQFRTTAYAAPALRAAAPPAWPAQWEGRSLTPTEVDPGLAVFLRDFPGHIAEFKLPDAAESILLRQVHGVTRMLHPAELCFAGFGWTCTPQPAHRDEEGRLWSCFSAERPDGTHFDVRQLYVSLDTATLSSDLADRLRDARSWPDAGSCFWAASLPGSTVSNTLAITHVLPRTAR